MNVYSLVYVIIAAILIVYTLKNRLDLLSMCAVCYIVYSIYCIPGIGISGFYRPNLSPQLYYLVYMQMVIILIFSILIRSEEKRKFRSNKSMDGSEGMFFPKSDVNDVILNTSFYVYTAIMMVFAILNITRAGFSGFAAGKATVWEETNIFFVISLYGSFPSFAYGFHNRKKAIWIPSLMIELTIFFSGARAFVATLVIIFICEKGYDLWKNRKGNIRIYFFGALAVVFLLVYRMIDTYIMNGNISGAFQQLKNPQTWLTALEFNESRVIIANYDFVLMSGIRLPMGDIVYRFTDFIPGLNSILPIRLRYPENFSTWLRETVHGSTGVGGTIWGESYAMFGVVGIIVFTVLWLCFVRYSNKHLSYVRKHSYFVVSLGVYLSWYINRLDFNRVGQVTKITILCFLMWAFIYMVLGGTVKMFGYSFRIGKYNCPNFE